MTRLVIFLETSTSSAPSRPFPAPPFPGHHAPAPHPQPRWSRRHSLGARGLLAFRPRLELTYDGAAIVQEREEALDEGLRSGGRVVLHDECPTQRGNQQGQELWHLGRPSVRVWQLMSR